MKRHALVIGAGHNGLVCAFYLARAGFAVTVCERRNVVGGAAVTEEFHPGFRNSVAAYTVSLLDPAIIAAMDLHARGLAIVERPIANFLPTQDGGYLKLGGDLPRMQAEVARHNAQDAARLPEYYAKLERVGDALRTLAARTPPGPGLAGLLRGAGAAFALRRLGISAQRDMLELFTRSARHFLDGWFDNDALKAVLGFDAVVGNYASPDTPGSAYVLLHHTFGGVNGKRGAWGHAIGGMGAITQAMARACAAHGVTIRLDAPVAELLARNGRAAGVVLQDATRIEADLVVSNLNPRLLFQRIVPACLLAPEFRRRIASYRSYSGTFRMNVALSELPDFTCLPGRAPAEHHASGIIIAPTLDYMDRAYTDARAHGLSADPIVEMLIPSTLDGTLAPPGAHVASLFCQHVAPQMPGMSEAEARTHIARRMIDTVTRHAPNFRNAVLGYTAMGPKDLEEKFGLSGGDIMHGAMSLDQLWAARPVLGHGAYRAPVPGLYMCGAGTHPGGGVCGLPGRNAAREIARDYGRWRAM